MATEIPPRSTMCDSTISTSPIIILIFSRELHSIMGAQTIPSIPSISRHRQCVLCDCIPYFKGRVGRISLIPFKIFQVNMEANTTSCSKSVYFIKSQPELSIEVSKSFDIVSPIEVEINSAIHSPLKYSPSTSITHITINLLNINYTTVYIASLLRTPFGPHYQLPVLNTKVSSFQKYFCASILYQLGIANCLYVCPYYVGIIIEVTIGPLHCF